MPYVLLDGKDGRQACWPHHTTWRNNWIPVLGSVCVEARKVVFEWGDYEELEEDNSLGLIWLQPKIDTALHASWTRKRHNGFHSVFSRDFPFEKTGLHYRMAGEKACLYKDLPVSLVADVIWPFDVRGLMGSPSTESMSDSLRSGDSSIPSLGLEGFSVWEPHDERTEDLTCIRRAFKLPIHVTLLAISLHVDRAAALKSGLFGLQADAPVQTVNYDDTRLQRQYYELFQSDPVLREAEPHVEKLFQAILSPEFRVAVLEWQKKASWLSLAAAWARTRSWPVPDSEAFQDKDPLSVWTPPLPEGTSRLSMSQHMPNKDHPWWTGHYSEERSPKIVPQVMVRFCDNQCYREENRPMRFGEVWFHRDHKNTWLSGQWADGTPIPCMS